MSICSGIGLVISCTFLAFNIQFRSHRYRKDLFKSPWKNSLNLFRYIRMSSPSLNNIILGGCMFAYISIILMGINSSLFSKRFSTDIIMNIICPVSSNN